MPDADSDLSTCDALVAACASARVQPYRALHKALRARLAHTQLRAAVLDAADPRDRAALVDEVERALAVCAEHLAHEDRFLHEPLRARSARAVLALHHDHLDQLDGIAALRLLLQRVRDAGDDGATLAYELSLRLSQFVADNLAHMAEEESTLTGALWAHFTDAELVALTDALHESLSRGERLRFI
jgi:hypothetical protein